VRAIKRTSAPAAILRAAPEKDNLPQSGQLSLSIGSHGLASIISCAILKQPRIPTPPFVVEYLSMQWIDQILEWTKTHNVLVWWLAAASLATCVLTPAAAAWLVIRLPPDYFVAKRRGTPAWWQRHPLLRPLVIFFKNLAGVALLLAGVVMLVVPGQGLLTMVAGLMLVGFPGKYAIERWLAMRPPVWRSLNWFRQRARREPLQRPAVESTS
jgi:hypothetical protein